MQMVSDRLIQKLMDLRLHRQLWINQKVEPSLEFLLHCFVFIVHHDFVPDLGHVHRLCELVGFLPRLVELLLDVVHSLLGVRLDHWLALLQF